MKARVGATTVAAALLLAGCGGSGGSGPAKPASNGELNKTGQQVANDAAAALQSAGAVHAKGTITSDGKPGSLDLQLQDSDISGSLMVGDAALSIVASGGKTYLKGSNSFWSQSGVPAAVASRLNDRWVMVPTSQANNLTSDFTVNKLADDLRKPTNGSIQPQVKPGTFNGQPTAVISLTDGSTAEVAATGEPYPLHLTNRGSDKSDIVLSNFGQRQAITAPPGALDLSTLG